MNFQPIHLNILSRFGKLFISAVALGAAAGAILVAQESRSIDQDRAGIERLHQQDIAATFSDKADELANLWDSDAVRIQPGRPAEVGKAVIYANDKRWEASNRMRMAAQWRLKFLRSVLRLAEILLQNSANLRKPVRIASDRNGIRDGMQRCETMCNSLGLNYKSTALNQLSYAGVSL